MSGGGLPSSMPAPLRLSLQLGDGETAVSFAARLGTRNGASDAKRFCADVGLSYARLSAGEPAEVRRLAFLGGTDADLLQFYTPRLQDRGWFVIGHARLKFTALSRSRVRLCPACVRENDPRLGPVHRGLWQVVALRVCQLHNIFLKQIKDVTLPDDPVPALQQPVAPSVRPLEGYLRDRIVHGPGEAWLDRQAFHVVHLLSEALGTLTLQSPAGKAHGLGLTDLVAAGSAGFEVIREGPTAVRAFLLELWHRAGRPTQAYAQLFRPVMRCLLERRRDPEFDELRELIREFVLDTFHVPAGTSLLGQPCGQPRIHTLATAARTGSVARSRLARQLEVSGQVVAPGTKDGTNHKALFSAEEVAIAVGEIRNLASMAAAGARLGLNRHQMERLCAEGLFQPKFEQARALPVYGEDEILRFVGSLRAVCRFNGDPDPDWQPLPAVAVRTHCSTGSLIRLAQAGTLRLTSTRPDPFHLNDFLASLAEVRSILSSIPAGQMTTAQTAKRLSISTKTVQALSEHGYLSASIVDSRLANRACRLFLQVEVESFARAHIRLRALPGIHKAKYLALQQFVSAQGIQPLQLRATDQKIFRRVEIEMISSLPGGENLDRLLAFPEGNADPDKHETKDSNPENNPEQEAGT